MVCEWGMSELGVAFGKKDEAISWPEIAQHRRLSEDTAIQIEQEKK